MSDLCLQPAHQLAARIRRGELTARELLDACWDNVQRLNPSLNAVVTTDIDSARRRADELDRQAESGHFAGPLHGLPITVKDTLKTAGMRSTAGARELADYRPRENALAVQRLTKAGAIVFGKTNTPKFAADLQTRNRVFGVTNNPWDINRTCGGSSGGSAVAAATGMSAFEVGSDIGGSLRTPAHFCGVYTIKPSYGIVPADGLMSGLNHSLVPRDISCIGPLSRSARDLKMVLDVIAGPAPDQAAAWQLQLPDCKKALRDFRVGVWLDDDFCPIDKGVKAVLATAVEKIRAAGVQMDEQARPDFSLEQAADVYLRLLAAASTADMTNDAYREREESLGDYSDAFKQRWAFRLVEYSLLSSREWMQALEARARLQQAWQYFFQQYDLLLCPVNPVTAFPHIESRASFFQDIQINGQPREYADMLVWVGALAGVSYLPAVSAPVGLADNGLPVGLQIIAPRLQDKMAIRFADLIAPVTGEFVAPPQ